MMNILKNISSILKNENDVVEVIEKGNLILISIKEECTFKEYLNYLNNLKGSKKNIGKLPIRIYIKESSSILECNLKKQLIWIENINGKTWTIAKCGNELKISLKEYYDEYMDEVVLEIKNDKYKLIKYIHDSELSTVFVKWYPENNENISKYFSLGKEETMYYMKNLLDDLSDAKILSDDVISDIYDVVGLKNNFDSKGKIKTYC